ncbi:hypothetical protein [Streptomyces sp. WM6373]|uniref:hypothetical protein n=1 Tax=Streptomyces sp. WM6373 TaxID=1415556 RepID=UPI001F2CB0A3|nr:hypothetical protein [Streptomyces sp. WM6373]
MMRQAFEQLRIAVADSRRYLPQQIGTTRVTEVGQGQIDLYAISGVPHPICHPTTIETTDVAQRRALAA